MAEYSGAVKTSALRNRTIYVELVKIHNTITSLQGTGFRGAHVFAHGGGESVGLSVTAGSK